MLKMLIRLFKSLIELLFPFLIIWNFEKKKVSTADCVSLTNHNRYFELDNKTVMNRLKEEHNRAQKIDEKTSKFTLGLSLCLTVLGVSATTVAKLLPTHVLKPYIISSLSFSSIYMLLGGIVSLGAFKLMATYGYGTLFEFQKSQNEKFAIARALVGQENINLVKQVRNEVAYLCIRNGLFFLLISLLLVSFTTVQVTHKEASKSIISITKQSNKTTIIKKSTKPKKEVKKHNKKIQGTQKAAPLI